VPTEKKAKIIKLIGLTINIGITTATIIGLYLVGFSWFALGFWAISAGFCMLTHETFYHRYFSHKSFKTGRKMQFVMGILAELAPVRGPIFWAAIHRDHHRYTDSIRDPHSPRNGIWNSYMGWVYKESNICHNYKNCADLTRFPELIILDRLFWLPMVISFLVVYLLGSYLEIVAPELGTSGLQLLVWGGFLRVLYVIHIFALLNFFSHASTVMPYYKLGYRNYDSPDSSRNLWWLGILGAGVGWHNNHHRYGVYASSKVMWWEIDMAAWFISLLEKLGLIWAVKWPPAAFIDEAKKERLKRKALRQDEGKLVNNNQLYQTLESYSKNLESKIEEKSQELEKEKAHVHNILSSMTEGLLVITDDLRIKDGYSQASSRILDRQDLVGCSIIDVLFKDISFTKQYVIRDQLENCLVTAFNLIIPHQFHSLMEYAPKHLKYMRMMDDDFVPVPLSLSFAPLIENENIVGIMVSVNEASDAGILDSGHHSHTRVIEALKNIESLITDPHDREAVGSSLDEVMPLAIESLKDIEAINHADLDDLFRRLHTVKGAVRSYKFDFLNYFAHEAETIAAELRDGKIKVDEIDIGELYRKGESLVNGLEHLYRIWTGAPKAAPTKKVASSSFSWDSYVSSLNKSISALSSELGKRVNLEVYADEGLTGDDLTVLKHALIHLIHNSIDHGIEEADHRLKNGKSEYGELSLEIKSVDGIWQVIFRDDGQGINPEKLLEISKKRGLKDFDPKTINNDELMNILCHPGFSSKEVTTGVSGRGVGMDAVRHSLQDAGGDISLLETGLDGTVYKLNWPQKSESITVDNFVPGEGILVVDDEPEMRSLITLSLEDLDLPLFEAESREAANEILTLRSIGVIITDISMDGGSGLSLISDISLESSQIPVIVITGSLSQPSTDQMLEMGIAAWLTKPCPHEQLLKSVSKALRQRKILAETELLIAS